MNLAKQVDWTETPEGLKYLITFKYGSSPVSGLIPYKNTRNPFRHLTSILKKYRRSQENLNVCSYFVLELNNYGYEHNQNTSPLAVFHEISRSQL